MIPPAQRPATVARELLVPALLSLCGCVFNAAGLEKAPDLGRADAVADLAPSREGTDGAPPVDRTAERTESSVTPDRSWQDRRADTGVPSPVSNVALGFAYSTTTVACVMADGKTPGTTFTVAESATVWFHDGTVPLAANDPATVGWVGGLPSVVVVYDPKACDPAEYPGGAAWGSAGILVRKASLQNGMLLLQAGVTLADMNIIDVNSDGTWQSDVFGTADATLSDYPQLILPWTKAKELILTLGL